MLRRLVVVTAAAVVCSVHQASPALANGRPADVPRDSDRGTSPYGHERPRDIPEFDPATVGAIAVMLAGGGVLLARRRKR